MSCVLFFFFSSRRRHTRFDCDWSSDVCSSDLYDLWAKWITQGMFFVTRLRHDLSIKVIEERSVPQNRNIRRDQLISLSSLQGQKECPFPLRRVEVWNPEQQETIVLLTNHLNFGASTISD